ncbi:MAG: ABC transporter permease [Acidobacteria bacterium]|nr:ABC transporter permease [Acidobacteriota bacterium]
MLNFYVRRLAAALWQIGAASLLCFLLFHIVPGDYYSAELYQPQANPAQVAAARHAAGLDLPWYSQYGAWVASCWAGEGGRSLAYQTPALPLVAARLGPTLQIALPALAGAWCLGLALGLVAARQRWLILAAEPLAVTLLLVPDAVAISLLLWLAVWLGWPVSGAGLPRWGVLASLLPVVFLHASGGLWQAADLPFVQLARSRGVQGWRLWRRLILPAAASPLVSLAGLTVAQAIGSAMLVEMLTGWPGLGPLFLESVQARDYPVVLVVILLLAAIMAVANLVADLALYQLDPRIREPQ